MTVGTTGWDALIRASGLDRLDARALAEHVSQRPRTWLLAHGEEPVPPEQALVFVALCLRRASGEPLAYLTGWREFMGHRLGVGPQVLVPRPETEHLVEAALALGDELANLRARGRSDDLSHDRHNGPSHDQSSVSVPDGALSVLDLGTGSGAIAISLALARPAWRIMATDCSSEALAQAQRNASALGANSIRWKLGSWWEALQTGLPPATADAGSTTTAAGHGPFDLIVSNPPYLAEDDPHLADPALKHEPRGALVSGLQGMHALETLAKGAGPWLAPCGWLLLEHGYTQGPDVSACLAHAGFASVRTLKDLAGLDRVTLGQWGRSPSV